MIGQSFAWIALLAVSLPAQRPSDRPVSRDWRAVTAKLDGEPDPGRAPLTRAKRLQLITAFLDDWATTRPAADEVLEARCRRGELGLAALDSTAARVDFDRVVADAPRDRLDLRGRARYGAAIAREMLGDTAAAKTELAALEEHYAGTRYADQARVARVRLRRPRPQAGDRVPEIGPRLDIEERSVSLGALRGRPALLLFWLPGDAAGTARIAALTRVARKAGVDPRQIIVVGLGTGSDELRQLALDEGIDATLLSGRAGFVDDAALRYGVRSAPSNVLVGPTGILLGRNLSPGRLETALERLSR